MREVEKYSLCVAGGRSMNWLKKKKKNTLEKMASFSENEEA